MNSSEEINWESKKCSFIHKKGIFALSRYGMG